MFYLFTYILFIYLCCLCSIYLPMLLMFYLFTYVLCISLYSIYLYHIYLLTSYSFTHVVFMNHDDKASQVKQCVWRIFTFVVPVLFIPLHTQLSNLRPEEPNLDSGPGGAEAAWQSLAASQDSRKTPPPWATGQSEVRFTCVLFLRDRTHGYHSHIFYLLVLFAF